MDRDGGWNPPELWPETTPPLPGWVRNEKGRWEAPVEIVDDSDTVPMIDLTVPANEPNVVYTPRHAAFGPVNPDDPEEVADTEEQAPTAGLNLQYASPAATVQPAHAVAEEPTGRRTWLIAAVIAVVIALLLVVLLVL